MNIDFRHGLNIFRVEYHFTQIHVIQFGSTSIIIQFTLIKTLNQQRLNHKLNLRIIYYTYVFNYVG